MQKLAQLIEVSIHVHPYHPLQQTTRTGSTPQYKVQTQNWAVILEIQLIQGHVLA